MRAVGLKTLKNKLSEYVRLAAGGETVLVTDRDRVVAELVPPRSGRAALLADAQLADAVRKGWLTPPVRPLDALHLASVDFLRQQGQNVRLATYDARMIEVARRLGIPAYAI